jgi:hypothetical protein
LPSPLPAPLELEELLERTPFELCDFDATDFGFAAFLAAFGFVAFDFDDGFVVFVVERFFCVLV